MNVNFFQTFSSIHFSSKLFETNRSAWICTKMFSREYNSGRILNLTLDFYLMLRLRICGVKPPYPVWLHVVDRQLVYWLSLAAVLRTYAVPGPSRERNVAVWVSADTVLGKEAIWVELLRFGEVLWHPVRNIRCKHNIGTGWEDVVTCKI
jgi:hypothetical protein